MKILLLTILSFCFLSLSNSFSQSFNHLTNISGNSKKTVIQANSNQNLHGTKFDSDEYSKSEISVNQDSSRIRNEIRKVYSRDQLKFIVQIQLTEYNIPIKIHIFNMLGNLVKEVYKGTAIKDVEYDFDASNLPNGLYLCILEGPNFRDAEKFTISR